MSKILILSDLHLRWQIAEKLLQSVEHDQVIQMGDHFDQIGDDTNSTSKTTRLLRKQLEENPKWIQLAGNHCSSYRWPTTFCRACSGFSEAKSKVINKILTPEHWAKFKLFHYVQDGNFLISHAGFDKNFVSAFIYDDINRLQTYCDQAIQGLEAGLYHPLFAAGRDRGGSEKIGGVLWVDFNSINPVPQFNQIVGHTRLSQPKIKYREIKSKYLKVKEFNDGLVSPFNANRLDIGDCVTCLDTDSRNYGLITDGVLTIHETPKEFFEDYQKEQNLRKTEYLYKLFEATR